MGNIMSLMVTGVIAASVAPAIANMAVGQTRTISQNTAQQLYQAEYDKLYTLFSNTGVDISDLNPISSSCEFTEDHKSVSTYEFNFSAVCTVGTETSGGESVLLTYNPPREVCDDDGNNGHGNSGGNDCSNPGKKGKPGPYTPGIFCPPWDPTGLDSFDNDHNVRCNPNWPG